MTTLIETMKQALAALEREIGVGEEITNLRTAIEQAENANPVAWLNIYEGEQSECVLEWWKDPKCTVSKPLYTAPTPEEL